MHRAVALLGIALSCMLALSSAACVNDMISIDDTYTYSNGVATGGGGRTGTVPIGRDPDSLNTFVRQTIPGFAPAH